ncbi:MAG: alpha/beta fold hydrolase [Candidatus Cloacimonetes bacterium]|nr:alpha/beta fold hydrolase [Candidatus Cloacimonadota bacterium]
MKKIIFVLLLYLILFTTLFSYDFEQFSKTYVDPSRDDRPILTQIYYPTASNEIFPTIVFAHGWLLNYTNYSQLSQDLAAEGWIVALPRTEGGLFPSHQDFALDLSFVANSLQIDGNDSTSVLYNMVDSISVVMGHSMGGGCAVLSAAESDVFDGLVSFAAAETDPSAINAALAITVPSITYSAADDNITPPASHQIPIYENLASLYKSFVSFLDEDHLGITSNQIAYNCMQPFLQYIITENISYLDQFEDSLIYYENFGNIQYQIVNNLNSVHNYELENNLEISNYPNPFEQSTEIVFSLPKPAHVDLSIYNLKGRRIKSLLNENKNPGNFQVIWKGENSKGESLNSGVYFYSLKLNNSESYSRKCILLK